MDVIPPRDTDLGGLIVRRLLPRAGRRTIGPWCFLDLVGPLSFTEPALDVPPHPHIGLQTVTWLLEGEMLHKDSLGSEALARPGRLNLMTSGRGIAHSEETPSRHSGRLHAVQLWVALPEAHRHVEPAFDEYEDCPVVELGGGGATVLMGELAGTRSAARAYSPVVGAEIDVRAGGEVVVPLAGSFEHGLVPLAGHAAWAGDRLANDHLYFLPPGTPEVPLRAGSAGARLLLIGGAPFGEDILMWWNFVARTTDEILAAREDWQAGRRFGGVRAYRGPRLEAPPFRARPVPANPMS